MAIDSGMYNSATIPQVSIPADLNTFQNPLFVLDSLSQPIHANITDVLPLQDSALLIQLTNQGTEPLTIDSLFTSTITPETTTTTLTNIISVDAQISFPLIIPAESSIDLRLDIAPQRLGEYSSVLRAVLPCDTTQLLRISTNIGITGHPLELFDLENTDTTSGQFSSKRRQRIKATNFSRIACVNSSLKPTTVTQVNLDNISPNGDTLQTAFRLSNIGFLRQKSVSLNDTLQLLSGDTLFAVVEFLPSDTLLYRGNMTVEYSHSGMTSTMQSLTIDGQGTFPAITAEGYRFEKRTPSLEISDERGFVVVYNSSTTEDALLYAIEFDTTTAKNEHFLWGSFAGVDWQSEENRTNVVVPMGDTIVIPLLFFPQTEGDISQDIRIIANDGETQGDESQPFSRPRTVEVQGTGTITSVKLQEIPHGSSSPLDVQVIQNPAQNIMRVQLKLSNLSNFGESVKVSLVNNIGRSVYSVEQKITGTLQEVSLNVEQLSAGMYALVIHQGNNYKRTMVMIMK
jgi:hypothetical protein